MVEKKIRSGKSGVSRPTLTLFYVTILMTFGYFLNSINLKVKKWLTKK